MAIYSANSGSPYPCRFVKNPILIDGTLGDPSWQQAVELGFQTPVTHETPISKTVGRILWDKYYLYVGYKAWDKDIWSYFTERDSTTCQEDCLELFFQPNPDKEPYYNFEINALGTIYDALNLKRDAGGGDAHRWCRWNIGDIKVAIHIEGEINNPDVIDEYWQMELAIPFAELPTLGGKPPKTGDTWKFHLARYDYSIHLPKGVELSSTAALSIVDFHYLPEWQTLKFE